MKMHLLNRFTNLRRGVFELLGNGKYTRFSLNDLDRKLLKHVNHRHGFFIEAGANDGRNQSNTYYFEKVLKWRGVLVEGIPAIFEQCQRLRTKSQVFNAALVSDDFKEKEIEMQYCNLMSVVEGAFGSSSEADRHLEIGKQFIGSQEIYKVRVPARTLTSILDEANAPTEIDLLSLDVEGYELNVLKGLDLEKYKPQLLCIEVRDETSINDFLSPFYEPVEKLTDYAEHADILYKRIK